MSETPAIHTSPLAQAVWARVPCFTALGQSDGCSRCRADCRLLTRSETKIIVVHFCAAICSFPVGSRRIFCTIKQKSELTGFHRTGNTFVCPPLTQPRFNVTCYHVTYNQHPWHSRSMCQDYLPCISSMSNRGSAPSAYHFYS